MKAPAAVLIALVLLATDGCRTHSSRGRPQPVCATQDCATGKMLDDGCSDDGRCMSCVNACPPAAVPSR